MPYTTNPKLPRLRMQAVVRVRRGESIRAVARHLGYSHSTVSRWVARAPFDGRETIPTLRSKPKSHPRALAPEIVAAIVQERLAHKRCAEVIHATLSKRGMVVSLSSVKRTLQRQELIAPRKWKRYRPPVARPPADAPGSLVQTDAIHFLDWKTKEKFYLYTVIDLHTRMAHASVHDRISQRWSYQTLLEAQQLFGFGFQTVQADNGPEFATWLKICWAAKASSSGTAAYDKATTMPTLSDSTGPSSKSYWVPGRSAARLPKQDWTNGCTTTTMTGCTWALSYELHKKLPTNNRPNGRLWCKGID